MDISEDQAAELLNEILTKLTEIGARDTIAGIDESRRLGIEESVSHDRTIAPSGSLIRSELKQLGTIRRRPLTNREMLKITIERIHQRLIVIPALAERICDALDAKQIIWRVDEHFVPTDQAQKLEATLNEFRPNGVDDITFAYRNLRSLIPEIASEPEAITSNG